MFPEVAIRSALAKSYYTETLIREGGLFLWHQSL